MAAFAPDVEVSAMYISAIDENGLTIVSDAKIRNNLPAALIVDSVKYDLYIDSAPVLHSLDTRKISIVRGGWEEIRIPMELDIKKLRSVIKKFEREKRDSAAYTLRGTYQMKIPVAGIRKFKIDETKILPAIRGIYVHSGKITFDKMGLKKTEMTMPVDVENHNTFPIRMKDGVYKIEIEHGIELHGKMKGVVTIPAQGSATIDIDINTKTLKLPKLGWKFLFKEHRTHYKMNFSGVVTSDAENMKNVNLRMTDEGVLDDIKKLTKKMKD